LKVVQNLSDCADISLVGGKAANLGVLLRAGFVVPDGFVITTAAGENDITSICSAYRKLSFPKVAVRSSAPTEDSAAWSMAGQFKTILNVQTEAEVIDAVRVCRDASRQPKAYGRLHGDSHSDQTPMAVVVQRQVSADVAGVLFTESPKNPNEILIEAAPGLGDNVVSGREAPDVFRIDSETGGIIESRSPRERPSLTSENIKELWRLARRVAAHFGAPQDIEWAISNNNVFLLQTRPITTINRELLQKNRVEGIREALAQSARGPWLMHNLAETISHPTPLTWSVIRKFMSGSGGFGAIYRGLGFDPAPGEFLELIGGKIYTDLSLAPGLFGREFPFYYDAELARLNPDAAQLPPSLPRGSWISRLRAGLLMRNARRQIDAESIDLDRRLRKQIIPEFTRWCAEEKKRDLSQLAAEEWIAIWREREHRLFNDLAPQVLLTNFIAAIALQRLRDFIATRFRDEPTDPLAQLFSSTGEVDETIAADAALREVSRGRRSLANWLEQYGHRAVGEFDLAVPRWREIPDALLAYANQLRDVANPLERHRQRTEHAKQRLEALPVHIAHSLQRKVDLARRYLVFRESGRHYLMLGYDLLRDMVLDASRRLKVDVAWLTFDELPESLREGVVPQEKIDQRKLEYVVEQRINLPHFIDRSCLSELGNSPQLEASDCVAGLGISSGFASGPARIVESPLTANNLGKGYVLICPSTDPQWSPLFFNASALVLENGGALSHGAIIARELSLPAVVVPNAMRMFADGEEVFVDGSKGLISRSAATNSNTATSIFTANELPAVGKRERRAVRLRNIGFIFWSLFLLLAWILPESWLFQPTLRALDFILWPTFCAFGKPLAIAIIASGLALLAATTQRLIIDNAKMRELRDCSRKLLTEAVALSTYSPQRTALLAKARSARFRVIGGDLVPTGILFGVFILSFAWVVTRINSFNPEPGSTALLTVAIDSEFRQPIGLSVEPPLRFEEPSSATRTIPPIRETLERLAATENLKPAERVDLQKYLKKGVPPQTVAWIVYCDQPGSFAVKVVAGNLPPMWHRVVFGNQLPPSFDRHFSHGPVRSIKVESVPPASGRVSEPGSINLDKFVIRWPWLYLCSYLIASLGSRRFLRLA
jgi:rifampicin phosphotransferase